MKKIPTAVDPNHLLRLLREIEDGYTILTTNPQYAVRTIGEQARFGTAFGSRPPLNIAALDLTLDQSDDSIPSELGYWCRRVTIAIRQLPDGPTVTDLTAYLRAHNHLIVTAPWAADYEHRLKHLRHRLTNENIWGNASPLVRDTFKAGPCINVIHDVTPARSCIGTVHITRTTDPTADSKWRIQHLGVCDTCGRRYDGGSLALMIRNQEQETA